MLSILHKKIPSMVRNLPIGLLPFNAKADFIPKLIVKISKEGILAAKVRQGFKIHILPYELDGFSSIGFVAAFLDDYQHPLTLVGSFFKEFHGRQLAHVFLSKQVDVHFFNELGYEMLAYRAEFKSTKLHRNLIRNAIFPSFREIHQGKVISELTERFRWTSAKDDEAAINVVFNRPLMSEDIVILDMLPVNNDYAGGSGYSLITLEREEPGEAQEKEIISLLARTFGANNIYFSPKRVYDGEEVCDVLVVTEKNIIIVQAKDSPNIEKIVNQSFERKRNSSLRALKKGLAQVSGAIGYLRRECPMEILLKDESIKIEWKKKGLYGLVVTKELFDDNYDEYTPPMLDLYRRTGVPCIALSYGELHGYTNHLEGDDAFLEAFMRVFEYGLETGIFPRLRVHAPGAI